MLILSSRLGDVQRVLFDLNRVSVDEGDMRVGGEKRYEFWTWNGKEKAEGKQVSTACNLELRWPGEAAQSVNG